MYFLLDACQHPAVLRTIYFGTIIRDIVFTIIPIGIVLMTIVDFSKGLIAGKEDEQQKAVKLIPKRLMYAIIVFAIPWVVHILMKTLSNLKLNVATNYQLCIDNAKSGSENGFKQFDEMLEAEEQAEAEQKMIDSKKRNSNDSFNKEKINGSAADNMAKEMLNIASAEVGNADSSRYGGHGQAWCALFVTWVMEKTNFNGINLYNDIVQKEIQDPNRAGASCTINGFKNSSNLNFYYSNFYTKKYRDGTKYTPKGGDIIYFDWSGEWDGVISNHCGPGGTWISHIGIVEYTENGRVHTIEGNSSNQVKRNDYSLDSKSLVGYGSWYA